MCFVTLQHCHLHRISAATLDARLKLTGIQTTIDSLRLGWAGHVARIDHSRLPRRFLTSWVRAKRPIGRPRLSTEHCINDTIHRADLDTKNCREREKEAAAGYAELSGVFKRSRVTARVGAGAGTLASVGVPPRVGLGSFFSRCAFFSRFFFIIIYYSIYYYIYYIYSSQDCHLMPA